MPDVSAVLPHSLYAELAPLPIPLAEYLYTFWMKEYPGTSLDQFLIHFTDIREFVRNHMSPFVRNREHDLSEHRHRYTAQWLRERLAPYTPNKETIPAGTYDHWQRNNLIKVEKKGHPTPDSGAAIYIMRMMLEGRKKILPSSIPPDEAPWWCYYQESPTDPVRIIPLTNIPTLPPMTICWTPWAGAAWDEQWLLVAQISAGEYYGAIRFAGTYYTDGYLHYNVTTQDLSHWCSSYTFSEGPLLEAECQYVARVILLRLANTRIAM